MEQEVGKDCLTRWLAIVTLPAILRTIHIGSPIEWFPLSVLNWPVENHSVEALIIAITAAFRARGSRVHSAITVFSFISLIGRQSVGSGFGAHESEEPEVSTETREFPEALSILVGSRRIVI
jgi:hypothetical protein